MYQHGYSKVVALGNTKVLVIPETLVQAQNIKKSDLFLVKYSLTSDIIIYERVFSRTDDLIAKKIDNVLHSTHHAYSLAFQLGTGKVLVLPKTFVDARDVQKGTVFETQYNTEKPIIAFRKIHVDDNDSLEKTLAEFEKNRMGEESKEGEKE